MQVQRIATTSGVDDLKVVPETSSEKAFLKQLADAGTLAAIEGSGEDFLLFRPNTILEEGGSSFAQSIENAPGRYDFFLRQNQGHSFELTFMDGEDPIDLNGYSSIRLQVYNGPQLTIGEGLLVLGEEDNVLAVSFTPEQTIRLTREQYAYDILFISGGAHTYYVEGIITVRKSITR